MWAGARRCAGVLAVLAVGLSAAAPAAVADVSSSEIVRLLGIQREANGIPGGLLERPDWSSACDQHNHYEAQSGEFGHEEDPSSPFYSAEGDWAGRNSVIAYGGRGWSAGNPWEDAPIHLLQMLAPALSEMGAAESYGHNCATTWPGYKRPSPPTPTAYSYPGDGVTGVVPTEYAAESPAVPGDFVGLPEGTATGRYLLAYLSGVLLSDAPGVTATATLSNSAGAVELRVVDSTSPDIGAYMPQPSAFLIPVQPLKPLTGYQAVVTWSMEGTQLFVQRFSFTTGTDPSSGPEAIKKKKISSPCSRYARSARSLRRRSAKLHSRGATLVRRARSKPQRQRGNRLLGRSQKLKRKARQRSKQARRCRAIHG
jgi:hypothetical protein